MNENIERMRRPRKDSIYAILSALGLATLLLSTFWYLKLPYLTREANPPSGGANPAAKISRLEKFRSEKEFKDYLAKNTATSYGFSLNAQAKGNLQMRTADGLGTPERFSETNVQVLGIDEPDIVKTDGQKIYFSSSRYRPQPLMRDSLIDENVVDRMMPIRSFGGVLNITAFPPSKLKKEAIIDKAGDLLLVDGILVIFENNKIYGYNVSDPATPEEKWVIKLNDNSQIVTSRLYQNKIYLVEKSSINAVRPCPIDILSGPQGEVKAPCTDVYHSISNVGVDATYTAVIVEPKNGQITKKISFIGSSTTSAIYMSKDFLYFSYYYAGDFVGIFHNFLSENSDLVGEDIIRKLSRLREYEISPAAKMTELTTILEQYFGSLDNDEQLKKQTELVNRLGSYTKTHKRDLDATGLVKIDLKSFNVVGNGAIPGHLLNQYSLDEYKNNLRLATTVGGEFFGGMLGGQNESANDIYILNSSLLTIGKITEMGVTERIYSARFVEDKGYLVTFRQTDPFYVLDLGNPRDPKISGELKIPGFSSYLHPLSEDIILGVGQENGRVKLSLFDVSDPYNPMEKDKYNLDDYYSEVQNNPRAFQVDSKHSVFFLPGSKGGYVFSYSGNNLKLVKAISDTTARRAVYIDDYLYVVSDDKIMVLSESDWEKVNELEL